MADELTDTQRQVVELYVAAVRDGEPWPTCRAICKALGITSTHAAFCHQQALVKKGWLEHRPGFSSQPYVLTNHARRMNGLPPRKAAA